VAAGKVLGVQSAKYRLRIAVGINGRGEVFLEVVDRFTDSSHSLLGFVSDRRLAFFLVGIQFFEFPLNLGFDGFGCVWL
jgi:hypothetical protein